MVDKKSPETTTTTTIFDIAVLHCIYKDVLPFMICCNTSIALPAWSTDLTRIDSRTNIELKITKWRNVCFFPEKIFCFYIYIAPSCPGNWTYSINFKISVTACITFIQQLHCVSFWSCENEKQTWNKNIWLDCVWSWYKEP